MSATRPDAPVRNIAFYAEHYNKFIKAFFITILLMLALVVVVVYQVTHRPIPIFTAINKNGQEMQLKSFDEPNLLPDTLIRWAQQVAVLAYTFDFVHYKTQLGLARPYFTTAGWEYYLSSIGPLINTITSNQLFVNGVVSGPPVISNQGDLFGKGYLWRIQMPFLVTYQSAETTNKQNYTVIITVLKIPTTENPAAVGVDQFIMS